MLEDSKEVNNPGSEPLNQVKETRSPINRNQKFFLVILLLIGFSMIGLWVVQLRQGIAQPFRPKGGQPAATGNSAADIEAAQNFDTDQDGLSDQSESNAYATSPYLDDTDGDGIKDGDEAKGGTDPNCPEGKRCGVPAAQNNDGATTTSAAIINNIPTASSSAATSPATSATGQPTATPGGLSEEDMKMMLEGKMTAAALRQALLNSGADPKLLEQLSDADLIQSYQRSLDSQ